jgi:UDP-N-acetylmuramoylalanine--D-glutamate ligase
VVVGAGASGTAAARLLRALGARVRLVDKDSAGVSANLRAEQEALGTEIFCGPHTPEQFAGASLVVTSPGVPLAVLEPFLREAGDAPLIAEMELALRYVREPILAVTGTSGKTTTASLASAMLEAAGKKVFLGGNIGMPLSDYVLRAAQDPESRADVLVLEMSSFQLQGSEHLRPGVAVLLNLSPNHLDHHKDMAEYSEAKFRIFALQDESALALLPESLMEEYRKRGFKGRALSFGPSTRFSRSSLLGTHNAANAEAAYLACREFGVSESVAAEAVAAFSPLPHRLEPAGEVDGVIYVNDSKSTTVDSMRVALESFEAPVLLLAGGKFKGGDLHSLHPLLRDKVKAVGLFGASREIFEQAWQGVVPMTWDPDLPSAVTRLRALAEPGDVVLLSPATSSFDLYENYTVRGEHFRRLVRKLQVGKPIAGDEA